MLFQINSMHQIIGWILVFAGLVICNEIARRTKMGGIFFFLILPAVLTIYFIAIAIGAASGADWAVKNDTYLYMNGWFHYAKLYAATAGCIGFMMIKYGWGIGKKDWFKPFPFIIVAINILIAVGSDFESAIKGANAVGGWWKSTEDVWLNGGWWNWVNGIAGILNIFCMTGWWGIYHSKDKNKQDMLWPDMTVWFIVAYDLWNFTYTYNTFQHIHGIVVLLFCLHLHSPMRFGTKAAGSRTVQTHLLYGVCSPRSSLFSRSVQNTQFFLYSTRILRLRRVWILQK